MYNKLKNFIKEHPEVREELCLLVEQAFYDGFAYGTVPFAYGKEDSYWKESPVKEDLDNILEISANVE